MGGPALADAGATVLVDNRELAVVGLFEVLRHSRPIGAALIRIRRHLAEARPDLVILIDFPDFNFLLMRMAKGLGIPVFYFISPQVWAWRPGRIRTLKRLVDDMAVILPFEVDFYGRHGMQVHYVGHPLLDVLEGAPSREEAVRRHRPHGDRPLVGLLPGSRRGEVRTLLPVLMETAARIAKQRPDVQFVVPLAPSVEGGMLDGVMRKWPVPVRVVSGDTHGVIRACDLIVTASGTVTLEAAILGTPMIITYRVSNLSYRTGRRLIRVDRVGLPNLIAGRMIAPELLQHEATPERLAEEALGYLYDPGRLARQRTELAAMRERLGEPGAFDRTARLVLERLEAGVSRIQPSGFPTRTRAILPGWVRMIYGLTWSLIWPHALLYVLLRSWTDGKYAESGLRRLGLLPPEVGQGAPRIWVHALSVGETISSAPLIEALKSGWADADIVFSTATETGQRQARKSLSPWVGSLFYMPHDLPVVTEMLIRRIQPRLFILVETDLWPGLLCALGRHGVPSVLVNGRLSPRSFRRMLRLKALWGPVLRGFQTIFAQSEADRDQYVRLGADASRVQVLGNLKFDAAPAELPPSEVSSLRDSMGIAEGRPAWIAGSTHEGEEDLLLRIHRTLRRDLPDLFFILAPRHPARSAEILDLCRRQGMKSALRSRRETAGDGDVLILDTLGELGRFYAVADAAFVGGSWIPFGGHNPLEAAAQGKPACWGPHLFNFRELEAELLKLAGFRKVESEGELEGFLRDCLTKPELHDEAARGARELLERHRGVARRLVQSLIFGLRTGLTR
jgi:lipid-A-disaccharide synthase